MEEAKERKSNRDTHLERMRKMRPDRNLEGDDEELFGAISADYDDYDRQIADYQGREEKYKENEKALSDMFKADPRSAQFLTDMHKGESPVIGLMKRFGPEIRDVLDDPSMQEEISKAEAEYVKRVAREKELKEEYERNLETTLETARSFQEKHSLSDMQIDEIFEKGIALTNDGILGRFTEETLEMLMKALNYDADVATAAEEGEIAGRNTKIVEKLRKQDDGDGTMPLGGSNSGEGTERRRKTMFDWARQA